MKKIGLQFFGAGTSGGFELYTAEGTLAMRAVAEGSITMTLQSDGKTVMCSYLEENEVEANESYIESYDSSCFVLKDAIVGFSRTAGATSADAGYGIGDSFTLENFADYGEKLYLVAAPERIEVRCSSANGVTLATQGKFCPTDVYVSLRMQTKAVVPTESMQRIVPDSGFAGLRQVTIAAAAPSGTDTTDADATSADLLSGKTAYVDGVKVTGSIPTYDGGIRG